MSKAIEYHVLHASEHVVVLRVEEYRKIRARITALEKEREPCVESVVRRIAAVLLWSPLLRDDAPAGEVAELTHAIVRAALAASPEGADTPETDAALQERLDREAMFYHNRLHSRVYTIHLLREAAARIAELEAERDKLRWRNGDLSQALNDATSESRMWSRMKDAEARAERLADALRPFLHDAEEDGQCCYGGDLTNPGCCELCHNVSAARRALSDTPTEGS